MAKIRCHNCGNKINSDSEYCPRCGVHVDHDERPFGGGSKLGCLITFFILVIVAAVGATYWAVQEHDAREAARRVEKFRKDSLKAADFARERRARLHAESLRMVNDSLVQAGNLKAGLCRLCDLLEGTRLLAHSEIIERLRERGYRTLSQDRQAQNVVLGLNATINDGKISGHGAVFSAVGLWPRRIEVMFSGDTDRLRFFDEALSMGFSKSASGKYVCEGSDVVLMLRNPLVVEIHRER